MTVDDLPSAAKEADRLGEQLYPGYRPSEIFSHERLAKGWEHTQKGHTWDPINRGCLAAQLWTTITTNRYFAVLMANEHMRDEVDEEPELRDLDKQVIERLYGGIEMFLYTGLCSDDVEDIGNIQEALNAWMVMRIHTVMNSFDDEEQGQVMAQTLCFEAFLAGVMFAQSMERADGPG